MKRSCFVLSLSLLAAACGGPEELGESEDELSLYYCFYYDDAPNTGSCAMPVPSPDADGTLPSFNLSGSDTDWFKFKTGSKRRRYQVFARNRTGISAGITATQCRIYAGSYTNQIATDSWNCDWTDELAASTWYWVKVQPKYGTGNYEIGIVAYQEDPPATDTTVQCLASDIGGCN